MSNNPNYSQDEGPTTDPAYIAAKQVCRYFGETVSPKVIMFIRAAYEPRLAELSAFIHSGYADANRERDAAAAELARVIDEMPTGNEIVGAHDSQEINNPDYWSMEQYIDFEIDKVRDATARFRATCALSAPNPEPAEPPASPGAAMENTLAD